MVDIISAREAYNESKYRKEADEILKQIAIAIEEACNFGKFQAIMSVNARTEKGAIDLVIKTLKEKGYDAVFTEDTDAAPYEHYWNDITVDWHKMK